MTTHCEITGESINYTADLLIKYAGIIEELKAENERLRAEIARCKEIAERDGKDYNEIRTKYEQALQNEINMTGYAAEIRTKLSIAVDALDKIKMLYATASKNETDEWFRYVAKQAGQIAIDALEKLK